MSNRGISNKEKRGVFITAGIIILAWNCCIASIWFFEKPENKDGVLWVWAMSDVYLLGTIAIALIANKLFPRSRD